MSKRDCIGVCTKNVCVIDFRSTCILLVCMYKLVRWGNVLYIDNSLFSFFCIVISAQLEDKGVSALCCTFPSCKVNILR